MRILPFFILLLMSGVIYANDPKTDLHCHICGEEIKSGKVYEFKTRIRFNNIYVYKSLDKFREGMSGGLEGYYDRMPYLLGEKCGKKFEKLVKAPPYGVDKEPVMTTLLRSYLLDDEKE